MLRSTPALVNSVSVARPVTRSTTTITAKATKAADFRGMSAADIDAAVSDCQRKLLDLRFAQRTRQDFKSSDFGANQLKIAQLLTIKREKQAAEGINKKTARSMEKKASLAMTSNALIRKQMLEMGSSKKP